MGFVYFFQARMGDQLYIKIGCTHQCPLRRLQEVKKKRPDFQSLVLLGVIQSANPKKDEHTHQKRFAGQKCYGRERDWFWLKEDLYDFIEGHATIHICNPKCHKQTPGDVHVQQKVQAYTDQLTWRMRQQVDEFEKKLRSRTPKLKKPAGETSVT